MPRRCGLCKKEGHNRKNCPNLHYKGEYNYKGERHGKGTYEYKLSKYKKTTLEDAKYEGDWVEGKREGQGVLTWTHGDYSGNKYEGEWKNDKQWGKGIMSCSNGDKYDGEWKNGKRHGKGIIIYANGDKYEGSWVDNLIEGKGVLIYSNGDKFNGIWRANQKNGLGVMMSKDGEVFKGVWANDKIYSGKGVIINDDGTRFEGEKKDGKIYSGDGVFTYGNNKKLNGRWENGILTKIYNNTDENIKSYIEHKFNSGTPIDTHVPKTHYPKINVIDKEYNCNNKQYSGLYTGQIFSGRRDGNGVMRYSNGNKYDGEWYWSMRHGYGIETLVNDQIWKKREGRWENGEFKSGTIHYKNGDVYKGTIDHTGKKPEDGILTYANGEKDAFIITGQIYVGTSGKCIQNSTKYKLLNTETPGINKSNLNGYKGEFISKPIKTNGRFVTGTLIIHNHQHGQGIMTYANGAKYEGEWKNGEKNGKGVMTYANGDKYEGEWKKNSRQGKGVMVYANGDKYEGNWKGYPMGYGKYIKPNGCRWEGYWHSGIHRNECKFMKGIIVYPNNEGFIIGNMSYKLNDIINSQNIMLDNKLFPNSQGIFKYSTGDIFEGEYRNTEFNYGNGYHSIYGTGILTYSNGDKYEGDVTYYTCKSKFVKRNNGTIEYKDGSKFKGTFLNDKYNGEGTFIDKDGIEYHGIWVNGERRNYFIVLKNDKLLYACKYKDGKLIKKYDKEVEITSNE